MYDVLVSLWLNLPLAQAQVQDPWGGGASSADVPPPAEALKPARRTTFSDLTEEMHKVNTGQTNDNTFRNGILVLLAVVALIVLVLNWRQRRKTAGPPDNIGRLGRQLGRLVRFPFGSRLVLKWVAHSTQTPFASLLLSSALFDKSVESWVSQPTFAALRHWGKDRLVLLRANLFDPPALPAQAAVPADPADSCVSPQT